MLLALCLGAYGFISQITCNDNDPLKTIVVTDESTYPSCVIDARPAGLLKMLDSGKANKALCVTIKDTKYADYRELGNVDILEPFVYFFEAYK